MSWDPLDLPWLPDKRIVVTGGGSGIGYFAAEQLAAAGARVVLAAPSTERAEGAAAVIRERTPEARVEVVELDLASLASVRRAADRIRESGDLDVLINNAGVGARALRDSGLQETADGHELAIGTNFLGHFALTAQLWSGIRNGGRVVHVGSLVTRMRRPAADLWSEHGFSAGRAYASSKHAVHGFAVELDRRLREAGDSRASILVHPGYAISAMSPDRAHQEEEPPFRERLLVALGGWLAQGKHHGAWPLVRAAADSEVASGQFYGPDGVLAGRPVRIRPARSSARAKFGGPLWAEAEERAGIAFAV